jgi:predicted amidohydrolase
MKAALLQFCAGQDKKANLGRALSMAREALSKGAEWILLPEIFNFRGDLRDRKLLCEAGEKIPGPTTTAFSALAKGHKVSFLLGSILEKGDGQMAYNTSILINALGEVAAKYRKIHLFDACIDGKIIKESENFLAGRRSTTAKIGEFTVGLSVCYDLRFPGLYQQYARKGVEILTVPSCFTKKTGEAHWEALLRARAIENLSYVLAPAQIGSDDRGMEAYGHSMIISPWGKVLACGDGRAEEIIFGTISMEEVRKARSMLPGIIQGGKQNL